MIKNQLRVLFLTVAERRERATTSAGLIDSIRADRPDMTDAVFYCPLSGNSAYTLITEREVFKAPLEKDQHDDFHAEINILKFLEGKGLPVPAVTCTGEYPLYYGMTRLPGVVAGCVIATWTPEQQRDLGRQLAGFAKAFDAALDEEAGRGFVAERSPFMHMMYKIRSAWRKFEDPEVCKLLGKDVGFCMGIMDAYSDRLANDKGKQIICPSDFHEENILVDPVCGHLHGVIDIGDVQRYLPEMLASRIAWFFGDHVAAGVVDHFAQTLQDFKSDDYHALRLIEGLEVIGCGKEDAQRWGMGVIADSIAAMKQANEPKLKNVSFPQKAQGVRHAP